MSLRLPNMHSLLCILVCYSSTMWQVASVTLQQVTKAAQQNVPAPAARIEDQAKFFQDFFSVQLSPYKIEFGHVCEDPNTWEQRYEKKDFKNHRDMGKVRWGDKQGGYGEHYWDLNHAGHADNHGHNDDGYDHGYNDSDDSYDEPSENSPQFDNSEESLYDDSKYDNDDGNRNKRAPNKTKIRNEKNNSDTPKESELEKDQIEGAYSHNIEKVKYSDDSRRRRGPVRHKKRQPVPKQEREVDDSEDRNNERLQTDYTHNVEKVTEHIEDVPKQQKRKRLRVKNENKEVTERPKVVESVEEDDESYEEDYTPDITARTEPQTYNQKYVTYEQKPRQQEQSYVPKQQESTYVPKPPPPVVQPTYENKYVPYEQGSGVRQHHPPELAAAASIPRLFWEPTTGHVVDRATGQAYVLQPIQI